MAIPARWYDDDRRSRPRAAQRPRARSERCRPGRGSPKPARRAGTLSGERREGLRPRRTPHRALGRASMRQRDLEDALRPGMPRRRSEHDPVSAAMAAACWQPAGCGLVIGVRRQTSTRSAPARRAVRSGRTSLLGNGEKPRSTAEPDECQALVARAARKRGVRREMRPVIGPPGRGRRARCRSATIATRHPDVTRCRWTAAMGRCVAGGRRRGDRPRRCPGEGARPWRKMIGTRRRHTLVATVLGDRPRSAHDGGARA